MSVDLQHDFTFNPDGSGRVTVRWSGPNGPGAPRPADFARGEIERAQGVDTWADVRCEEEGDRLVFTGTAWFPDARALRFHCQGFHVSLLDFAVSQAPDGSVSVASVVKQPEATPTPLLPADASADEIAAVLAQERDKLAMARGFVDGMFGGLRCSAVLRLPGALQGPVRHERVAANAVRVQCDGDQLLTILDRLASDDELMVRLLRRGGLDGPAALFELLGDQGPVALRTGPGAMAQFDYAAEVAGAQEQFAALADELQAAMPEPEPAEPLANVRVVACKIVHEADGERDLSPQGQSHPGVTLTVAGDLPGPALDVGDAAADRIVLADGRDVTPPEEWDRRCHFPKTTKDGTTVYLDFDLKVPTDGPGLAELAGHVVVTRSDGETTQDLGFAGLEVGASGTFADARITQLEQEDEARWRLELQVMIARTRILRLELVDGDTRTVLEQVGYSCCNDESNLTYRIDGTLPEQARLELTTVTDLSRTRYGFELQHCDWLGRAL